MKLYQLFLTENACYKAGKKITVKGIMVHSTGANNPWLKRYVGPDDGRLGKNQYNNHWNTYHPGGREVCVHGFIGKLADGTVATYQCLPWNHRGWHAGGSANNTHIGFEICEDGLADATYFKKVYQEAIDLCVYLCKEYGLTEKNIICHSEGYKQGEVPQYYVENSHPAIISPEVFDMVQTEVERRRTLPTRHSGVGLFASRIFCGDCGAAFGAKVWHSNDKYRKVIYQCNHKFKGKEKCSTPKLEEEQIKELFVKAVNLLITDAKEIIRNYEEVQALIFDTACFDAEITELQEEMTVTAELIQKCVDENARTAISQDKYKKKYDVLVKRFEKAKKRLQEIHDTKRDREARRLQTDHFMRELKKQESVITEFNEVLWYTLVDRITVYNETDIRFTFKDETEYKV